MFFCYNNYIRIKTFKTRWEIYHVAKAVPRKTLKSEVNSLRKKMKMKVKFNHRKLLNHVRKKRDKHRVHQSLPLIQHLRVISILRSSTSTWKIKCKLLKVMIIIQKYWHIPNLNKFINQCWCGIKFCLKKRRMFWFKREEHCWKRI